MCEIGDDIAVDADDSFLPLGYDSEQAPADLRPLFLYLQAQAGLREVNERNCLKRLNQGHRQDLGNLIKDIFGNPFHPVAFSPHWFTSSVVDLADAIYNERTFDRMPYLGDALMDAGCDSDEMIQHCRGSGPHVRGCWVVDLILGKS